MNNYTIKRLLSDKERDTIERCTKLLENYAAAHWRCLYEANRKLSDEDRKLHKWAVDILDNQIERIRALQPTNQVGDFVSDSDACDTTLRDIQAKLEIVLDGIKENNRAISESHNLIARHASTIIQQRDEIERLRAIVASSGDGWQPIETAPNDVDCEFWLDWADDYAKLNSELPWDHKHRSFLGKNRCWSSIYKGLFWRPLPPLSPIPRKDNNA